MVEVIEPIDLLALLKTGRSGPIEFGVTDRDAVRALNAGRYPVSFGGASPLELHALPDALAFLHKAKLSGPVGAGLDRAITIELIDEPRRLTLGYEVAVLPVDGTKHVAHEIDYFLSAVWVVDESLPGE